jgi:hypothetical protein
MVLDRKPAAVFVESVLSPLSGFGTIVSSHLIKLGVYCSGRVSSLMFSMSEALGSISITNNKNKF